MLSFECIKNEKSVYFLLTSAKSEENWVFKFARSTSAQAGEILLRTTLGITANDAWYHRERRLVSPRMTPAITGVHGSRHRTTPRVRDA